MAMPCPDAVTLERFLLGRLPRAESERVEDHFGGCAACCTHVEAHTAADAFSEALRRAGSRSRAADPLQTELIERVRRLVPSIAAARDAAATSPSAALQPRTPSGVDAHDQPTEPAAPAEGSLDFLAPPQAPGEIGRLGPYRVLRVLGRGGMGLVFEVEDPELQRRVALKVIAPQLSAHGDFRKRFLREARAAAGLTHDHVVPIYHVGEDRGLPYIAMPLLQGESLEQRLRREPQLAVAEAARIGRETALGLAAAHERGLVHRDVKPANIWLEEGTRRVKLLDFGLARAASADMEGLTAAGSMAGTPGYAAAEQAEDLPVDGRADLFGLGVVLYRMLTGSVPYPGTSMLNFLKALAREVPVSTRNINPQVPRALSALVTKLTAKDPARRPESAEVVAAALAEFEAPAGKPAASAGRPPTRRAGLVATGAALFAVALVAAGMVIVVRDKNGKEVGRFPLPENGSASIEADAAPARDQPVRQTAGNSAPKSSAVALGPLDQLDPVNIPAAERFPWQPKELVAVLGEQRRRHSMPVRQVAWSGDGRWVASIAEDGLRLIETATLKEKLTPGLDEATLDVAFTLDGKTLAATMRKGVFLWDVSGPEPVVRDAVPVVGYKIALSGDGKMLAVVDYQGELSRWDLSARRPRERGKRTKIGSKPGRAIALAPDGMTLASGWSDDRCPRLWDLTGEEPKVKAVFKPYQDIGGLAFSADGRVLASEDGPAGTLYLWDLSVTPPGELVAHALGAGQAQSRDAVAFARDGESLAVGMTGQMAVFHWDGKALKLQRRTQPLRLPVFSTIAFSPDAKRLVTGDEEGEVRFWDLVGVSIEERQPLGPWCRGNVAFAPDGGRLVGGPWDLSLWDLARPLPAILWSKATNQLDADYAFAPHGRQLLVWGRDSALLCDLAGPDAPRLQILDDRPVLPLRGLSADGKRAATCGREDGLVKLWDLTAEPRRKTAEVMLVPAPREAVNCPYRPVLAFSPDLGAAAFISLDGTIHLWDLAAGKERATWQRGQAIACLAFSRDGGYLATGGPSGEVRVWDLSGAAPIERHKLAENVSGGGNELRLHSLAFSPDGRRLAGANMEARVSVWDLQTQEKVHDWKFPSGQFQTVRWAEDSRHLATVNANGTIYLLRVAAGAGPSK